MSALRILCIFVLACGTLPRGLGNVKNCSIANDDHQLCTVTCRNGYTFLPNRQPDDVYKCGPNTTYKWSNVPPACSSNVKYSNILLALFYIFISRYCFMTLAGKKFCFQYVFFRFYFTFFHYYFLLSLPLDIFCDNFATSKSIYLKFSHYHDSQ